MAVEDRVQCVHIKLSPSGSFVREVHDTSTYFMIKKHNRESLQNLVP
jgi:hypothetical protein